MIKRFMFLICLLPVAFIHGGPPWLKYNVGYNYILRGIDFPSNQETIGFIAGESLTYNGDGIVLMTTNGGDSWTPVWTGLNCGIEGSCFVDLNNGFVAGWPKLSNGWSGFGKTTDGGATWTSPAIGSNIYYFTDVVFKDASNGIVIGSTNSSPVVYVTSNGGNSWVMASGVSGNVPLHACYVSGNTYFLTDNGGHIKKSTDNGLTWTIVHTIPGLYILGIKFYNDLIGMACGDNGVIITTNDGGTTWQNQQVGTDLWHDFGWESQERVFCCGTPEIIAESENGGTSWFNGYPQSAYQAALYECIFTTSGKGFICGSQGTLLKRAPSCTAAFTAESTEICAGDAVNFSSQSTGNVSTFDWLFPGGTPGTSNSSDPVVTYSTPGIYDVRLIVNNGYWSDTLIKTAYIHVSQPPIPVISVNGTLLTSNVPTGNQWYLDGSAISGATNQNYSASLSGWYWARVMEGGCLSDTSNNIYLQITGSEQKSKEELFHLSQGVEEGILHVTKITVAPLTITLTDLTGRLVASQVMAEGSGGVANLKIRQVGCYLLRAETSNRIVVKKVLVH